jgi:hypothetical protein
VLVLLKSSKATTASTLGLAVHADWETPTGQAEKVTTRVVVRLGFNTTLHQTAIVSPSMVSGAEDPDPGQASSKTTIPAGSDLVEVKLLTVIVVAPSAAAAAAVTVSEVAPEPIVT